MIGKVRVADSSERWITNPQVPPTRWWIITMPRQPNGMPSQNI